MLRRDLKRLVRANEGLSLLEVRREATRWVEERQQNRDRAPHAPGHNTEATYPLQCESTLVQM